MIQFLTVFIIAVLVVIDQLIKLAVLRTDWQLNGHSESDSAFIS